MQTFKIMSFNLRNDYSPDGINVFPNRKSKIIEMLRRESPDIIGTQEVTDNMRNFLRDELGDYEVYGCGREADYHGEHTTVLLKKNIFEVIEMRNEYLSYTPSIPGRTFGRDQSPNSRMYTYVRIKSRNCAPFQFVNTHLDYAGPVSNNFGMLQVLQDLNRREEKWILTGDMNVAPDSEVIKMVSHMPGRPAMDCTEGLGLTFHGFGKAPDNEREKIDYIFSDAECNKEQSYVVSDAPADGIYYSDHFAVCAYVTMP